MRFTVLRTTIALLLPVAAGCGYDSTTPSPPLPTGLWIASGSPSAILRLDPSQLSGTGDRTPATAITTPSARLYTLVAIAFAAAGDLWIASQDDSLLLGFAPGTLTSSGFRAATTVIAPTAGSLSGPTGLAFDSQRRRREVLPVTPLTGCSLGGCVSGSGVPIRHRMSPGTEI